MFARSYVRVFKRSLLQSPTVPAPSRREPHVEDSFSVKKILVEVPRLRPDGVVTYVEWEQGGKKKTALASGLFRF